MLESEAVRAANFAWREYHRTGRGPCCECTARCMRWKDDGYGLRAETWCGCTDDTDCPAARAREERQ